MRKAGVQIKEEAIEPNVSTPCETMISLGQWPSIFPDLGPNKHGIYQATGIHVTSVSCDTKWRSHSYDLPAAKTMGSWPRVKHWKEYDSGGKPKVRSTDEYSPPSESSCHLVVLSLCNKEA